MIISLHESNIIHIDFFNFENNQVFFLLKKFTHLPLFNQLCPHSSPRNPDLKKREATLPRDDFTQVTVCLANWFLLRFLIFFSLYIL